jgi:hypothetical protein
MEFHIGPEVVDRLIGPGYAFFNVVLFIHRSDIPQDDHLFYLGSPATLNLNAPIVGMAITPDGAGYWMVAQDGGVFAYGFLTAVVAILVMGWRRRGRDAAGTAERFVARHPAVLTSVGRPVRVGRPEGEVPSGSGAAQANLIVPVGGPKGDGRVDLVMARLARQWEVLSATLVVDGDRVRLAEGPTESRSEDDG